MPEQPLSRKPKTDRIRQFREVLEEMVWQFGVHGIKDGKPVIGTGGTSALEAAFAILGWPDPMPVVD